MNNLSFGRQLFATSSVAQWRDLEKQMGLDARFEQFDLWLSEVFARFLKRQRLATLQTPKGAPPHFQFENISDETRVWLEAEFALENQQSRGALYHPAKEKLSVGWCNLGWYFAAIPNFAVGAASDEVGSPPLKDAEAIAMWGVTAPFFDALAIPFRLRGPLLGEIERAEADVLWEDFCSLLADLQWDLGNYAAPFQPGSAWLALGEEQRQKAKIDLLLAMGQQSSYDAAQLFRCRQLRELTARFYAKCNKETLPRKKVLHKAAERLLCGFFGGDWSAALNYWGETPHPEEVISGPLPQVRLLVGTEGRVAEVAAQTGLPEDQVRLMVESFWDSGAEASPIEQRVHCLRDYWQEFGAIHDKQAPGMKSLWGLVSTGGLDLPIQWRDSDEDEIAESRIPIRPGLYFDLLSDELNEQIEVLWGKALLPRYPERVATSLNPHAFLGSVYGDALNFWNGISLTAWFLCEGPSSRTDLPGLTIYYRRQLEGLQALGTPVNDALFSELMEGSEKLGEEVPLYADESQKDSGIVIMHGSRRDGFEVLRDIIKTHRDKWADEFLDAYLKNRWESEMRKAGSEYTHQLHAKGKPLTPKIAAKIVATPTNHWFGGDLSAFCSVIGTKSPVEAIYERIMPLDRRAFAERIKQQLSKNEDLYYCGAEAVIYLQVWEAIGRKPEVKEFAMGRSSHIVTSLKEQPQLWKKFIAAIEAEIQVE